MQKHLIRAGIIVLITFVVLIFAARFIETAERAPEFAPPGYRVAEMAVPGRATPVRLHIWYPTDSDAAPVLVGQNALFYGAHVRMDAPPRPGPHPVVVFSHGSGGNAERTGWLLSYLAHLGMIVAAPDHPGTTSNDSDPFLTSARTRACATG